MIGHLTGTALEYNNGQLLLEVRGVGYLVNTIISAEDYKNSELSLWTYLAVRETSLDLYGFLQKTEKDLFVTLLQIPKIGPKSALQIMQKASEGLIWDCVAQGDHKRLAKTSGIGAKTAEKIVHELHDETPPIFSDNNENSGLTGYPRETEDLVETLIALGYHERDAYQVAHEIATTEPDLLDQQGSAIKKALQKLS